MAQAFTSDTSFVQLVRQVRAGNEEAIAELITRYGPHIRRIARVRLQSSQLGRLVESKDICQSVLANFVQRAREGRYELESPSQLISLLATMTRNQVSKKLAYHRAQRRDLRRDVHPESIGQLKNGQQTPSLIVSQHELLERIRALLSPEDHYLLEQRAAGRSWVELAQELGTSPDAVRKRATRATRHVVRHLEGIADSHEQ